MKFKDFKRIYYGVNSRMFPNDEHHEFRELLLRTSYSLLIKNMTSEELIVKQGGISFEYEPLKPGESLEVQCLGMYAESKSENAGDGYFYVFEKKWDWYQCRFLISNGTMVDRSIYKFDELKDKQLIPKFKDGNVEIVEESNAVPGLNQIEHYKILKLKYGVKKCICNYTDYDIVISNHNQFIGYVRRNSKKNVILPFSGYVYFDPANEETLYINRGMAGALRINGCSMYFVDGKKCRAYSLKGPGLLEPHIRMLYAFEKDETKLVLDCYTICDALY